MLKLKLKNLLVQRLQLNNQKQKYRNWFSGFIYNLNNKSQVILIHLVYTFVSATDYHSNFNAHNYFLEIEFKTIFITANCNRNRTFDMQIKMKQLCMNLQ